MKTNQTVITHIPPMLMANNIAIGMYEKWSGAAGGNMNFMEDLREYFWNGIVISMPHVFALARWIKLDTVDEPVLFVRMAVGYLPNLVPFIPSKARWIAFCRRNNGIVKAWPVDRLRKLAYKLAAKGKQ